MTRRRRRRRRTASSLGGTLFVLAFLLILYFAQQATQDQLDPGDAPAVPGAAPTVVDGNGAAGGGWYEIYFSDPQYPDDPAHRLNGLDEPLVAAILGARQAVAVAVYDIGLQSIADALITVARRGVEVRVVTDSDNSDRSAVVQIAAAGIPVVDDGRGGLMHNKFVVIDRSAVFTGSYNLTDTDTWRNNNSLLRINSARLAQNYLAEFDEMFVSGEFGPTSPARTPYPQLTINGVQVENYFAPEDGVAEQILEELRGARDSIYFMAFAFTRQDFSQVLIEQAAAGVTVRGVYETQQLAAGADQSFELLSGAGLDVLEDGNPYKLHHKAFLIDGETVIVGSYNFSKSAEETNDENVLIIHDPEIASAYLREYAKVWLQAGGR